MRKPPPEHTRFKPGQSGNPAGTPKGILRRDDVEAQMGKFANMTREQLQEIVQNPKSTMLQIMIAAVMARAAKDGDYARLQFLLDRSIGKVKDVVEQHQHNYDEMLKEEPRENVIALLREMRGPKVGG